MSWELGRCGCGPRRNWRRTRGIREARRGCFESPDGHEGSRCLTAFQVMGPATHRCGAAVGRFVCSGTSAVARRVLWDVAMDFFLSNVPV